MPTPHELIYLAACLLAMCGLAAQSMGWAPGLACAGAGVALAVAGTVLAGWEGVLLVGAAITLAGAVAAGTACRRSAGRRWRG